MNKIVNAFLVLLCLFLATIAIAGPSILSIYQGGTGLNAVASHQVFVGTATNVFTAKTVPDCPDTAGRHLNFTQSGDSITCGTHGSSSGGGIDPTSALHLYDEFCGALTTTTIGELSWFFNGGGGGVTRFTNNTAVNQNQHPCLFSVNASVGSNWEWLVLGPINSATAFRGIDTIAWTIQASVSDGIDTGASKFDTTLRFGWVNNTGVSTSSPGMYFECVSPASPTSANWSAVSQDAGGTTSTNTGTACNSNFNFNDLKITNDGAGNLEYFINGTSVATQSTHVTSGAVTPAFGILNTNSSANSHQFGIDYFDLDMTLSR